MITIQQATLDDCAEYARTAIEKSLRGEDAVSKMFDSEIYDGKLFVYSVPVYRSGEIIGALAASDTLEIFEDIVNGNTVLDGQGYIHLLDSGGNFLVRSEHTIVKEDISSIFEGPYLSEKTQEKARAAIANRESMYGEFEYKGKKCGLFGRFGCLSFNGNKIITTSGGGALICHSEEEAVRVKFYPHFVHQKLKTA